MLTLSHNSTNRREFLRIGAFGAAFGSWFMQRHSVQSELAYLTQAMQRTTGASATETTPGL
jgi:hypothetical protein